MRYLLLILVIGCSSCSSYKYRCVDGDLFRYTGEGIWVRHTFDLCKNIKER